MKAVIGIGTNMGDRMGYIKRALSELDKRAGQVVSQSSVIETKAYGYTDQDDFLNLAVTLETGLEPYDLLSVLMAIEKDLDRTRLFRWGPRTIDLDILFYDDRIIDRPDLHIPHIDFYNRDFVLGPVCEIEPDLTDPRTGKTVTQLYEELKNRS